MADNLPVSLQNAKVSVLGLNSSGGPREALAVAILNSSGAITDGGSTEITVRQSTAGDLNVTVAGYVAPSTTVSVNGNVSSNSSIYLPVRLTNGTAFIAASVDYTHNSTADFTGSTVAGPMSFLRSGAAAEGSTDHTIAVWGSSDGAAYIVPVTSTGETLVSTVLGSNTVACINARAPIFNSTSYANSTAFTDSSLVTIASSGGQAFHCFGYSLTSTVGSAVIYQFSDSLASDPRWTVNLSSGYGGANLAVTPPAYLFRISAGSSFSLRAGVSGGASSNRGLVMSVSYYLA